MKKPMSCAVALVVVLIAANAAAQNSAPTPLRLKAGHSVVLDVERVEKLSVGDPAIADVKTIGETQILVVGQKEGKTELRAWTKEKTQLAWAVTIVAANAPDKDLAPGAVKTVDVKIGSTITMSQKDLNRVAVGDPDVADIEVSKAGLSIKGVKAGSTTMILWFEGGKREVSEIRVTP